VIAAAPERTVRLRSIDGLDYYEPASESGHFPRSHNPLGCAHRGGAAEGTASGEGAAAIRR